MADATKTTEKSKATGPFLRGEGSMTNLTIVATVYDNGVREPRPTKDGTGMTKGGAYINNELARFANVNDKVGPQFDPALVNEKTTDSEGKTQFNKSSFYNKDSLDKMREASGANSQTIYRHVDGKVTDERIGEILTFDANVFPRKEGGLAVAVDSVKPTGITVPENVQTAQYDAVGADRKVLRERMAAKEAAKGAPAAEPEKAAASEKTQSGPEF